MTHGNTGKQNAMKGDKPMVSHLHCRITPALKVKFVRAAKADGDKRLCEWVIETLSKEL